MARPRPLVLATGRPNPADYHSLTPRTPHSRAGRAEEDRGTLHVVQGDDERDADEDDEDDHGASPERQQAEPLLASSASEAFPVGYRYRADDVTYEYNTEFDEKRDPPRGRVARLVRTVLRNVPLWAGIVVAVLLLILILLSLKRPDVLQKAIGSKLNVTDSSNEDSPTQHPPPPNDGNKYISYENYTHFPLLPNEYKHECAKLIGYFQENEDFWGPANESLIADVYHPPPSTAGAAPGGAHYPIFEGEPVGWCTSTITYMLDGDVGLLADLALMSQVAGLARERNRTFLVDDTYWNRGKWTDHFQDVRELEPGPEPGCRAPPPDEMVACPRFARHWVVNSRTAQWHLGHEFYDQYENPYAQGLGRRKSIFMKEYNSLISTIRPNAKNAAHIRAARKEVAALAASLPSAAQSNTSEPYIGVHIRRGDRHSLPWVYNRTYLPTEKFAESAIKTWSKLYGTPSDTPGDGQSSSSSPLIYVASDTPDVQAEFASLVSKSDPNAWFFSLATSDTPGLRDLASPGPYKQADFARLPLETRVQATRGMLVDFALLSGAWAWKGEVLPAAGICGITSNVCKMMAVGMGWNRAFGMETGDRGEDLREGVQRWVEIDNGGMIDPEWQPYELFQH